VIGIGRGTSTGGRIMLGIMIGMVFNLIDKVVGQLGLIYALNPIAVAVLPSLVVFLAACLALRRVA
jgi:lipopolysaccharide export system permease protein